LKTANLYVLYLKNLKPPNRVLKFFYAIIFLSVNLLYLNAPLLAGNQTLVEPILLGVMTIFCLAAFIKCRNAYTISSFELFYLGFTLYTQLHATLVGKFTITDFTGAVFVIILYFCLKQYFQSQKSLSTKQFLLWVPLTSILLYLITAFLNDMRLPATINHLFSPNKSIFAILLASQLLLTLPIYWFREKNIATAANFFIKTSICIVWALAILLLLKTEGRAGWIGLATGVIYILYRNIKNVKMRRTIVMTGITAICLLLPILLVLKPGSSKGRLLIYKVSANLLRDNWLWGIGNGQFKIKYNQYQAAYFSKADINSKEALLADNSFYAFNDPLQTLIENGIIGFALWAIALYFLFKTTLKVNTNNKSNHLLTAATASFLCISIASLFSYPLQIFPISIHLVTCLAIINTFSGCFNDFSTAKKRKTGWVSHLLIALSLLVFASSVTLLYYEIKVYNAQQLSKSGFKKQSLKIYDGIKNSRFITANTLYLYANGLYYDNQLLEAATIIKKSKLYYCSNEVFRLHGRISSELKNFSDAENNLKTTVYMAPNRMASRFDLLNYYLQVKDTANARYWGNSILKMPVKVPSSITLKIQENTALILNSLQ
jgi:hypothetical protein